MNLKAFTCNYNSSVSEGELNRFMTEQIKRKDKDDICL